MGYDKKKKVIKENKLPKKNTVLDGVKKELNESALALGIRTMKDNPPFQVNEGPAYEYRKPLKNIEKDLKNFSIEVLDFYELLRDKGLNKEADNLLKVYKKYIIGFNKDFKNFARKLM